MPPPTDGFNSAGISVGTRPAPVTSAGQDIATPEAASTLIPADSGKDPRRGESLVCGTNHHCPAAFMAHIAGTSPPGVGNFLPPRSSPSADSPIDICRIPEFPPLTRRHSWSDRAIPASRGAPATTADQSPGGYRRKAAAAAEQPAPASRQSELQHVIVGLRQRGLAGLKATEHHAIVCLRCSAERASQTVALRIIRQEALTEWAVDQRAASGAVHRTAEGHPHAGCMWVIPTTQRGAMRRVAGRASIL